MPNTTRWALPYPASTDPPAGHTEIQSLAVALDGVAMDDQGTLANRPVSTSGSPGKKGRYYMATDKGTLYRDNGTGWDVIGAATLVDTRANRPAANTVAAGTRFVATDQIAEWISDGTTWTRLGAQAGETAITLAASATAGKILLQGQAWPATTGIYADLYALFGGTTLPDMRQRVPVGYKSGDADMGTLLATGGEKTHVLTVNELPAGGRLVETTDTAASGGGVSTIATLSAAGGGAGHNNLQPFIVVNFEAKL